MDVESQRVFSDPVLFARFAELLTKQQEIDQANDILFEQIVTDFFTHVISFVERELNSLNVRHIVNSSKIEESIRCRKFSTLKEITESVRCYVTSTITEYLIQRIPLRLVSEERIEELQKYNRSNICYPDESNSFQSRLYNEILCLYEERNIARLEDYNKKFDETKIHFDEFMKHVKTTME
jgi:hypothetical protein